MATQVQLRRGTSAENDAFTGALGEVTVDTTNNTLRVHDGSTAGGFPVAPSSTTASKDLDNLSNTGKANISAQGTYNSGATYNAGTVGEAIQGKANVDMDNLTATGKNIGLWCDNAANIIAEIPQDINLTLSAGTLTLKAGSKCYLKTDTTTPSITVASDLTTTQTTDGTYFAIYDGSALATVLTTTYDYSTLPSTYSLPLAKVTVSNGAISSIDQVFNGFGFIGNKVYILPGVKCLIPDGRNANGTLKNNIFTTSSVNVADGYTSKYLIVNNGVILPANSTNYAEQDTQPSFANGAWYNPTENIMYTISSGVAEKRAWAYVFDLKKDSSAITDVIPKLAFRAVDYSDTDFITHQAMPSTKYTVLSLGASGNSYTAPADGYYEISLGTNTDRYVQITNNSNNIGTSCVGGTVVSSRAFMVASKGDSVTVYYSGTSAGVSFRFVYANGAK